MNKANKKPLWKRLIWPVAALALLLAWLLLSNQIIMALLPASQRISKAVETDFPATANTFGGVDAIIYSGGITETLSVSGWCFSETEGENPDKRTQVVLVKDGLYYLAPQAERSYRGDIYRKLLETRAIQGPDHGYSATFATFPMPSGRYDIYLYNSENEADYGLYKTGYAIQKNGAEVETAQTAIVDNFAAAETNSSLTFRLDNLAQENGSYRLSGWGLLLGVDSNNLRLYAEFTPEDGPVITGEIFSYSRPDIAKSFNDGVFNYLNSGASALLPTSAFAPGRYTLRVIADTGDAVYRSEESRVFDIGADGSAQPVEENAEGDAA